MAITVRSPRLRTRHPGLWQLGIFALAYLVYFGVRAVTQGSSSEALDNARGLIDLEVDVGIAWEGDLQDAVLQTGWIVDLANAVYVYGHWPVIIAGGVLLFRFRPEQYFRLRDACLLSGAIGLVLFGLFPVAPPRLTDLPLVDTVTQSADGYRQLFPAAMVNEYAAMPSFHAGWNLLLGIVVFSATRNRLIRALAIVGPASMLLAVVVTANHFIADVVVGVLIVLAALAVCDAVNRRRSMGRSVGTCDGAGRSRGRVLPHRPPRRERPHAAGARAGFRGSSDGGGRPPL